MVRKEPKLRPSNTWSELELMIKAAEFYIQHCVNSNQVTLETLRLSEVKDYFESFKPADSQASPLAKLLKTYGAPISTESPLAQEHITMSDIAVTTEPTALAISPLDMADLTDEQKYDMIKMRKESTYTDAEQAFILNTGTMIMMRRASVKPVNSGDL